METVIVPKVGHEARSRANFVYLPHPVPTKTKKQKHSQFYSCLKRKMGIIADVFSGKKSHAFASIGCF